MAVHQYAALLWILSWMLADCRVDVVGRSFQEPLLSAAHKQTWLRNDVQQDAALHDLTYAAAFWLVLRTEGVWFLAVEESFRGIIMASLRAAHGHTYVNSHVLVRLSRRRPGST